MGSFPKRQKTLIHMPGYSIKYTIIHFSGFPEKPIVNLVKKILTKYKKDIRVTSASLQEPFKILAIFSDGSRKEIDFFPFLNSKRNTYLKKYLEPANFINFSIEDGNIVWGEEWDLIFPVEQLYTGYISI